MTRHRTHVVTWASPTPTDETENRLRLPSTLYRGEHVG